MTYTLKQFAFDNGLNRDNMSHDEYYQSLVDKLGYEDVLKYIPFSLVEINKAIKKDKHLNNLSLEKWDEMTGVKTRPHVFCNQKGLYFVYKKHGINCFSQSDGVCLLKACARMALIRENIMEVK